MESPTLNNILFLTLLISFNIGASEIECTKGIISQFRDGNELKENSHFCYNQDKTRLTSYGCQKNQCVPTTGPIKMNDLFSSIGTPGFKLCRQLGGRPEIIEFFVDSKGYKLDRCWFKNEFINTGLLFRYLKSNGSLL